MKKIYLLLSIAFIIILMGCAKQNVVDIQPLAKSDKNPPIDELASLVTFSKDDFADWKLSAPVKIYDKDTIFEYIDGAAELYLAYNFSRVTSAEYKNAQTSILIDVYDMVLPENAFGIYSLIRYQEANYVKIGNEGILTDANLDFWQGKYYCKIYSLNQSEEYQKAVVAFGNKLSSRIIESGQEPNIIKKLPIDGLIAKSEKYFTRKLGLDNVHFISEENVLELDGQTKGAMAEYSLENKKFKSFIVEYPSSEKALSAFGVYSKYLREKGEIVDTDLEKQNTIFKIDNKFTYIKLDGNFITGFWDIEYDELVKIVLNYIKINK